MMLHEMFDINFTSQTLSKCAHLNAADSALFLLSG